MLVHVTIPIYGCTKISSGTIEDKFLLYFTTGHAKKKKKKKKIKKLKKKTKTTMA